MGESGTVKAKNQTAPNLPVSSAITEASLMLDLFEGLGVRSHNLTLIDEAGSKVAFKRYRLASALRTALPGILLSSSELRMNVIVRPIAPRSLTLIQLDDLTSSHVDRVRSLSFLVLETSPGNFQAWLAASPPIDLDTVRMIKKAAGGDPNASGATRLAGSYNFKRKYVPNYPRVRLWSVAPKRIVTIGELEQAELIAAEERRIVRTNSAPRLRVGQRMLVWPSYARCLADAPAAKNHEGKDRSAADFEFCLISLDRGWSIEATTEQLLVESEKARSVGRRYALYTARRASDIINKNR